MLHAVMAKWALWHENRTGARSRSVGKALFGERLDKAISKVTGVNLACFPRIEECQNQGSIHQDFGSQIQETSGSHNNSRITEDLGEASRHPS